MFNDSDGFLGVSFQAWLVVIVIILLVWLWHRDWKMGEYDMSSWWSDEGMAAQPAYSQFLASSRLVQKPSNRYYLGGN